MKKILLTTMLLLTSVALSASNTKKIPLAGIWQQVQLDSQSNKAIHLPVWKVLENDGTFHVFLIADAKCQCIITNQGLYEVKSDSTFSERITGSITDANLVGRSNTITYHFDGPDKMNISYQIPGAASQTNETWVRVKLEMPK